MLSKISRFAVLIGALASASSVSATGVGVGFVQDLYAQANGVALFGVSGTASGTWPNCVGSAHYFAINTSTAGGMSTYAAVLSAKLAGKRIYASGDGTCSLWGDAETIQFVSVVAD